MSLSPSTLAHGLEALTNDFPASYDEAGQRWAQAYCDYGQSAEVVAVVAFPADVRSAKPLLASTLASIFESSVPAGDYASIGAGIAAALTTFWLAPPQQFFGLRIWNVTAVAGTAALASGLAAAMTANEAPGVSASDACRTIANLIDAFTKTIVVTSPAPPPPQVGAIF